MGVDKPPGDFAALLRGGVSIQVDVADGAERCDLRLIRRPISCDEVFAKQLCRHPTGAEPTSTCGIVEGGCSSRGGVSSSRPSTSAVACSTAL